MTRCTSISLLADAETFDAQLGEALKSRKATFLASDQWIAISRKLSIQNQRQLLLDVVAHIPGLLERGDQIKLLESMARENTIHLGQTSSCWLQSAQCLQIIEYFGDCDSLIHKLDRWLKSLEESEGSRLWWYSDGRNSDQNYQQPHLEKENEDIYSSTIQFSSSWIPGIVIYYWSGLLELSAIILEVRQLFHHNMLYAACFEVLGADSPSLSMRLDSLNELAIYICHTVIHLSSSLEGCSMAHIPAGLAENYFTRLLSPGYKSRLEDDSDPSRNSETAYIGLQLCKKGLESMRNTLRS